MKYEEVINDIKLNNDSEYIAFNLFLKKGDFYLEKHVISGEFEFDGDNKAIKSSFYINISCECGYIFDYDGEDNNYVIYVAEGDINNYIETDLEEEYKDLYLNTAQELSYLSGDIFKGGVNSFLGFIGECILRNLFNDLPFEFDVMTKKDKLIFYKLAQDKLIRLELDNC